jgi:predicted NBD/HSP70 family sugar kinase
MIKVIIILVMFVLMMTDFVYAKEVSYTLEDRERIVRLETKVDEGFKAVNQRIDGLEKAVNQRIDGLEKAVNQRIDGLQNLIYVVISGIFILIGFVIWDRRTALAPAIRKNKELEEREEIIEKVLKEYAKEEPRLAEILKSLRLM